MTCQLVVWPSGWSDMTLTLWFAHTERVLRTCGILGNVMSIHMVLPIWMCWDCVGETGLVKIFTGCIGVALHLEPFVSQWSQSKSCTLDLNILHLVFYDEAFKYHKKHMFGQNLSTHMSFLPYGCRLK